MGIQDDKPIPYKTFAAIKSQLVTELQLTPLEWLKLLGPNLDSTGNPQNLLSTSGYVTETNSSSINSYCSSTTNNTQYGFRAGVLAAQPLMGLPDPTSATYYNNFHRINTALITIAAGGAVTNVELVPAVASYKPRIKIKGGLWSSVADATTTWYFHDTVAACVGCPASPGFSPVNITATYTIITQINDFLMYSATAGRAIDVDVAGVGAGAATLWISYEYWYEA